MSYNDLRDFTPEYTHFDPDTDVKVEIEKLGGGTVGRAYVGLWRYVVTDADGSEIARGQDLETPGIPRTHAYAAALVLDFILGE